MPVIIVGGGPLTVSPMGMNKNTPDQEILEDAGPTKIIGWTVRSGFGSTVIANDELIANGPGAVVVQWGAKVTGDLWLNETRKFELMRNNTAVSSISSAAGTPALPNVPLTLAPGDRIWLRIVGSTEYDTTVSAGAANTYIFFNLAP